MTVATLVLAACTSPGVVPERGVAADSADQIFEQMQTTITRGGVRATDVLADSAWVYQSRNVADLKQVTMTFFNPSGDITSTVTADSGVYHIRDGTLDARGNVVAVTADGGTLRTEHLLYDRNSNRISSDTAYTFTSPSGTGSGDAFESDPDLKNIRTVRPRGRQRGEGFLLPGQDTAQ